MSSDVDDDQVLPDSLQKLEIVPVYTHSQSACKANNERNNPFFSELSAANRLDDRITKDLFGPTCSNCESNDNSCTINSIDSANKDATNKSWRHRGIHVGQCNEHSINKQIHFKHRDREKSQILSDKKLHILREPILKSIGRSMYHNGNKSKSCCESKSSEHNTLSKPNAPHQSWFGLKACTNAEANELKTGCGITKCELELSKSKAECQQGAGTLDANNVMIHRIQNWQLNDDSTVNLVDFKSLINECDSLSLSGQPTAPNSITELHKTKNFQVLQANQLGSDVASTSGASGTISDSILLNNSNNAANANNVMNSSLSSNSSNSSSCSQQARMNSSNCDVTIDELASYIEFQLHLPKPMSSNVYEAMFS